MSALEDYNLILLIPSGRSGSYLIQSLFDSHPEISMFPGVHNYYDLGLEKYQSVEEIARDFAKRNLQFFDSQSSYFNSPDCVQPIHYQIDSDRFIAEYAKLLKTAGNINNRNAWIMAHLAYSIVIGQKPESIKYIFFHLHIYSAEIVQSLLSDFPGLYFLASTRDPREEWSGYIRQIKSRFGTVKIHDKFLSWLKLSVRNRRHLPVLHDKCRVGHMRILDLARLHLRQGKAVGELANWLNIKVVPQLIESTFVGQQWMGNGSERKSISGLQVERAKSTYRENAGKFEVELIEYFYWGILRSLNYPPSIERLTKFQAYSKVLLKREGIAWTKLQDKKELIELWCKQSPSRTSLLVNVMRSGSKILPFGIMQTIAYGYLVVKDYHNSVVAFFKRYSLAELRELENISETFLDFKWKSDIQI